MIHRVFVEKRRGFDVKKQKLEAELKSVLGINAKVRIIIRYDMQGNKEDFKKAIDTVFSVPPEDKVYLSMPKLAGQILCVSFLQGQYDQRADSAAQCVQMLTSSPRPEIKCATIYAFDGVNDEEFKKIKEYIINPVECCSSGLNKPKFIGAKQQKPPVEKQISGFKAFNNAQLKSFYSQRGFAFSFADLCLIQNYFKAENRNPFEAELKVLDTYWSDHCRHTTFNTQITDIQVISDVKEIQSALDEYKNLFAKHYGGRDDKYFSLMSMATIGAKELEASGFMPNLDKSDEINACSIKVVADVNGVKEDWIVMFKNETHNHPTEIEPFGGAATCLGGAIRDPLSGRVYVYHAMRISGAGDINAPLSNTMAGKLPQRVISKTAASGFSSYGNQIGLATGIVKEYYHKGYAAKRLEAGFVVGAAPAQNIVRQEPKTGDVILLIGGGTGRDGCGGATGSSKAHKKDSLTSCGAEVQKGNAPTERKLQRLFRNGDFAAKIKRCNDFGAGGVSVAVGELTGGMDINLDSVPKKYAGLSGTELAISESQERMAVVVSPLNVEAVKELCAKENVEASQIALVTDTGRMRMFYGGKKIVDLKREFLDTNGVRQSALVKITDKAPNYFDFLSEQNKALYNSGQYFDLIKNLLSHPATASQKGMGEMFDSTIGSATVLMPFGGKNQLSPPVAMAAKLPVMGQTNTATVASYGFNPYLSQQSPFVGAVYAVALSVIKTVISGADLNSVYLTLQEYFEKLSADPLRWGKPASALLGALYAQLRLKRGAIGGKDSMSGSYESIDVPPTLISFALGVADARLVVGGTARAGCAVYRFKLRRAASGVLDFDDLLEFLKEYQKNIKHIQFAQVAEDGGVICALIKAVLGDGLGFKLTQTDKDLFTPLLGDIVFGVSLNSIKELKTLLGRCQCLGTVDASAQLKIKGQKINIKQLASAYTSTFEAVYPTDVKTQGRAVRQDYHGGAVVTRLRPIAKPRVFIPVFPGTNCEYDCANAFLAAGAEVNTGVLKNLTPAQIAQSVKEIALQIDKCNIMLLPGGFSGGDEPDGSGKFIAATLISPYIAQAINNLLYKRDGLILGICNGFQALIKLGLLPYGHIQPLKSDSPTLSFNSISRHISQFAKIRIASNLSPWLSAVRVGEVFDQPFSHGEGRFIANKAHLTRLATAGQIATQYVDQKGNPTLKFPFNPNGSVNAIEGITSPDGRIFGKMGHSERFASNLYKNIDGNFDLRLFASGVNYFK